MVRGDLTGNVQTLCFGGLDGFQGIFFADMAHVQVSRRFTQKGDVPLHSLGFRLTVGGQNKIVLGGSRQPLFHGLFIVHIVSIVGVDIGVFPGALKIHQVSVAEILCQCTDLYQVAEAQGFCFVHIGFQGFCVVHDRLGVGHGYQRGEAAFQSCLHACFHVFLIGEPGIAQMTVHVDKTRHQHLALAVDFPVVRCLYLSLFLINLFDLTIIIDQHLSRPSASGVDNFNICD